MHNWYVIISGPVIAAVLIILNGQEILWDHKKHTKRKFKLWQEIYRQGPGGKDFSEEPSDLLNELHKDGVIELESLGSARGTIIRAYAKGLKPHF